MALPSASVFEPPPAGMVAVYSRGSEPSTLQNGVTSRPDKTQMLNSRGMAGVNRLMSIHGGNYNLSNAAKSSKVHHRWTCRWAQAQPSDQ